MTTRDPYITEAAERIAKACTVLHRANEYRTGIHDSGPQVNALADTLKELGWRPPISPEEKAMIEAVRAHVQPLGGTRFDADKRLALDAIERYKALVPCLDAPGIKMVQHTLRHAEEAIDTMVNDDGGVPLDHQFRATLQLVRELLNTLEAR